MKLPGRLLQQSGGNRRALPALIASAVLCAGAACVQAGDGDSEDMFALSLRQLIEVQVSSSTKTSKALKTAPASVTVYRREQIENLGAEYLFELLNYVPGFQVYRQGESSNQYFHSVRGHRNSTKSREVLILVDGERFIREFDNAAVVPMLPLHNVEKIEFIRGPGSALYGSNAFLGVINITTVKGISRVDVSAGTDERGQLSALATKQMAGWQFDIAAHVFDEAGESYVLENDITFQPEAADDPRSGEDVRLTLQSDTTRISASLADRRAEEFYVTERTDRDFNVSEDRFRSVRAAQRVDLPLSTEIWLGARYSEASYVPRTRFAVLGRSVSRQEEENTELFVHGNWSWSDSRSVQFGVEYRDSDLSAFTSSTEARGELVLYPALSQELLSSYLQAQWVFAEGAEVILGARYDSYDDAGNALSPRFGIVKPITDNQSVKLLYGEAFRAPTANELFLNVFSITGNPNLDPETIKTWEAIWLGQWQRFSLGLNGFYNVLKDTIVRDDSIPAPNFYNVESEEAYYGFEFESGVQLTDRLLVTANASNFHNLPSSDFRQADWLASVVINYALDKWNFSISSTYADEREMQIDTQKRRLDDYWLVASKIRYSLQKHLDIYLSANNLLDEDYETPTQRTDHTVPIPNRGREIAFGVAMSF